MFYFKTKNVLALILMAAFSGTTSQAQQTTSLTEIDRWKAYLYEIKPTTDAPSKIPMLQFVSKELWVDDQGPIQFTTIEGVLKEKVNQLNLNGKDIPIKSNNTFEIYFGFPGKEKLFVLTVLDSKNKTHRAEFKITSENLPDTPPVIKRLRYAFGTGLTRIEYSQTNLSLFNELAVTVKGGITYRLIPDRVDTSISSFYNAAVLKSSSSYSVRYLGINLRAGYHVIRAPSKFRFILNGGFYFNTSFGSIGFSNMYGPQLYPEASYLLKNGHAILGYAKFSPALSRGKLDFATNRELAVGTHYSFPLNPSQRMSVGVDFSKLELSNGTDLAKTSTYSLSVGLSF